MIVHDGDDDDDDDDTHNHRSNSNSDSSSINGDNSDICREIAEAYEVHGPVYIFAVLFFPAIMATTLYSII